MRLGDLDALRQHSNTFHTDDGPVEAVPVEEIDAAPSVSCGECKHRGSFACPMFKPPDAFFCAHFERRQP